MPTESPLSILVMGAGALGCVTGGLMAKDGHDLTFIGRAKQIDAMNANGITITGIWGDHHTDTFSAVTSINDAPKKHYDLILLAVKSYDTEATLPLLKPHVSDDTLIISYQSGLGNAELIAAAYGWDRCVEARVIFGARITEPGIVDVTVMAHKTALGVYHHTPYLDKIKRIAEAMDASGVPTEFADNIAAVLWYKLAYNCSLNPLSALFDVPYANLLDTEDRKQTMCEVLQELYAVGHALGIQLNPPTAADYIDLLFGTLIPNTGTHYASMREDVVHQKRTEIDSLNGAIVRHGKKHGIPCPTNARLTKAIREREAKERG
ncbi:MAG: ketopantoate reductase family protein [Candidatus Hydrogenedentota bacterium]